MSGPGDFKAAGIVPTYCDPTTGNVSVAVVWKKGRVEILGGKVEACDQRDAWSTALREMGEETNHVWGESTLGPHMITRLYYIANAKYMVFVLQVTRAHFDTPSDAFGEREEHDNVERRVVWMPIGELDRLVHHEHKARFPGLFDGICSPHQTKPLRPVLSPEQQATHTVDEWLGNASVTQSLIHVYADLDAWACGFGGLYCDLLRRRETMQARGFHAYVDTRVAQPHRRFFKVLYPRTFTRTTDVIQWLRATPTTARPLLLDHCKAYLHSGHT